MTIGYSLIVDKLMYGIDSRKLLTSSLPTETMLQSASAKRLNAESPLQTAKAHTPATVSRSCSARVQKPKFSALSVLRMNVTARLLSMITSVDAAYGEGFKEHDD